MVLTGFIQCIGVRCLDEKEVAKLEGFHFRRLREICGWRKYDFKSHDLVYKTCEMMSMKVIIECARITWANKAYSLPIYRIPKLLTMNPRINVVTLGLKRPGHLNTWDKCLKKDLVHLNLLELQLNPPELDPPLLSRSPKEVKKCLEEAANKAMILTAETNKKASDKKYLKNPAAKSQRLIVQKEMKDRHNDRIKAAENISLGIHQESQRKTIVRVRDKADKLIKTIKNNNNTRKKNTHNKNSTNNNNTYNNNNNNSTNSNNILLQKSKATRSSRRIAGLPPA